MMNLHTNAKHAVYAKTLTIMNMPTMHACSLCRMVAAIAKNLQRAAKTVKDCKDQQKQRADALQFQLENTSNTSEQRRYNFRKDSPAS